MGAWWVCARRWGGYVLPVCRGRWAVLLDDALLGGGTGAQLPGMTKAPTLVRASRLGGGCNPRY